RQWLRIFRKLPNSVPAPHRGHFPCQPRNKAVRNSTRAGCMLMTTRWALGSLSSSRPFVPRRPVTRDRTPRDAPIASWALLAARQRVPLDPFDDVDDLEQQAAGGGVRLDELQPEAIAQPVGLAGALADQDLAAFVVAEEFLAERADRDQPVGAGA